MSLYNKTNMSEKDAIKVLHYYQKWRRGADIAMPSPCKVGEAIDVALRTLRKSVKK